jgi:hypothetical protein
LDGAIPSEIGGLTRLSTNLCGYVCLLTGSSQCTRVLNNSSLFLVEFDAQANRLTGEIPSAMQNLSNLGKSHVAFRVQVCYSFVLLALSL